MTDMIIKARPTPKKAPSKPIYYRFAIVRVLMNNLYRDPHRWSLFKCVAFFAVGVYVAKALTELEILPPDAPAPAPATPSAY